MKFLQYWAKAEGGTESAESGRLWFRLWRGSSTSLQEARAAAEAALQNLLQRVAEGHFPEKYVYGEKAMREEIVETWQAPSSASTAAPVAEEPWAVVSRNRLGCSVLNTARVMFVDVDMPVRFSRSLVQSLLNLLSGRRTTPQQEAEQQMLERFQHWIDTHPGSGCRVYRTFAGYRLIMTHEVFDPLSASAMQLMKELGVDPMYAQLCQVQNCFRARLTPKPWRCGAASPPIRHFPIESLEGERLMHEWLSTYQEKSAAYQVCRFVQHLGLQAMSKEIQDLVERHDELTGAQSNLPLA